MKQPIMEKIESASKIINRHYRASYDEIKTIAYNSTGCIEAASKGFNFGYLQGMKAAKAEMRKGGAVA